MDLRQHAANAAASRIFDIIDWRTDDFRVFTDYSCLLIRQRSARLFGHGNHRRAVGRTQFQHVSRKRFQLRKRQLQNLVTRIGESS